MKKTARVKVDLVPNKRRTVAGRAPGAIPPVSRLPKPRARAPAKRLAASPLVSPTEDPPVVLTIGHSTRTIEEFVRLLRAHSVTRVVDVRTVPRSRHNPQFNRDTLPASLKKSGIGYVHLPGLGGLRHTTVASVNTGWRNTSFRGYADYMQTTEFQQAIGELIQLAGKDRLALMCAEAVPWRCHRSLIEDALLVRGIRGEDIMSATLRRRHALTAFAKVQGTQITYPADVSSAAPEKASVRRSPKPEAKIPARIKRGK
jgi:hypothetical protein